MTGPTTLHCSNCSAPLEPPAEGHFDVTCRYCGVVTRLEPPAPSPSAHFALVDVPTSSHHEARPTTAISPSKSAGCLVLVPILFPIVILSCIFGVPALLRTYKTHFGAFPLTCSVNEEITISGRTFTGKGAIVEAVTNCKVTIEDSTLKADQIVKGDGANVQVTVRRSKLEAREQAFELGVNGKLKVTDQSDVYGAEGAAVGDTNLEVTVEDSKLRGDDLVVRALHNGKVTGKNATFEGKRVALDLPNNGKVTLKGCSAKADLGISAENNADLSLEASTIDARVTGIKMRSNGKLRATKKSSLKGGKTGVEAGSYFDLVIDGSRIEGGTTGLHAESMHHLDATGSTLAGGTTAIALDQSASRSLSLDGLTLKGAQSLGR